MTLCDTHCHLDLEAFSADREAVIARAESAGVTRILVPSLSRSSALRTLAISSEHPQVFAALGVHPTEADHMSAGDLDAIESIAAESRIVAIGEIGLDYYWVKEPAARSHQRDVLRTQLSMAQRLGLPAVIHLREEVDAAVGDCSRDLLVILEEWVAQLRSGKEDLAGRPGVLHSFSGTIETARRAMELGFYVGVTGPITYRRAEARRQLVASLPLDRLLIETDAPFLAPEPHRGKRNEPAFVVHIADRIADVQSRTPRDVADVTSANAARLFAWGEAP